MVLERPLYDALGRLARREGTSLSTKARDLIRDALEAHEDLGLAAVAEEREKSMRAKNLMMHSAVWRKRGRGS